MSRRLPTTRLSLVALIVALVLLSHDLGMAAEPHRADPHVSGTHHVVDHHGSSSAVAGDDLTRAEVPCLTFEAARTSEPMPELAPVADLPYPLDSVAAHPTLPGWFGDADPGAPPGQLRALLQVWLN
jgi:hypothetical protein